MPKIGTEIFCPQCQDFSVCKAISPTEIGESKSRQWYFEDYPDLGWFRRCRKCFKCGHNFLTVEIDEKLFNELIMLRNFKANYINLSKTTDLSSSKDFGQYSFQQHKQISIKSAICQVCGGDGGIRGGCRKCDGTGWVNSEDCSSQVGHISSFSPTDNSRITNANYKCDLVDLTYRDRDGRFGSTPVYDDYSEESNSD